MKNKGWMRFFHAPDNGGGSGGGGATNTPSNTPATGDAGGIDLAKVFPGVDFDNLDDNSRAALTAQAQQFATLQTNAEKAQEQARQFQSRFDQTQAELNRIKTSITGNQPQVDPQQAQTSEIENILISQGVDPKSAKAQAPVMGALLAKQRENILKEVGVGVAPIANLAMNQQAEQAFNYARATDSTGAMNNPEIAQAIWNSCKELVKEGTQVTADTVTNLKYMHFGAHAEKNPALFATLQMNQIPGLPGGQQVPGVAGGRVPITTSTGGFSYPGATFSPSIPSNANPNGTKTTLDSGTRAALTSIFSQLKPGHQVQ